MVTFLFKISSISDVITNSSSELFVFNKDTHQGINSLIDILNDAYPQWRLEYNEPQIVAEEYDDEDLEWFFDWYKVYEDVESEWVDTFHVTPEKFNELKESGLLNEAVFAKKLNSKPEEFYENWEIWNPGTRYDDTKSDLGWKEREKFYYLNLSTKGLEKFREFCKENGFIALESKDENPDFDKQEILMSLATSKFHLG